MSGYTQLPREQRYQILTLMKTGPNQIHIGMVVEVYKATIRLELPRNQGLRSYRPQKVHSHGQLQSPSQKDARLPHSNMMYSLTPPHR